MRAGLLVLALLAACGSPAPGPTAEDVCADQRAVQDALQREPAFGLRLLGRAPVQQGVAPEPDGKTGQCATTFVRTAWPAAAAEAPAAVAQVAEALAARGWTEVTGSAPPPRPGCRGSTTGACAPFAPGPLLRGYRAVLDGRPAQADVRYARGEVRLTGRLDAQP